MVIACSAHGDNRQPIPSTDAVHRLNGCGELIGSFRYSRSLLVITISTVGMNLVHEFMTLRGCEKDTLAWK
jgi:hypothetical protein